MCDLNQNEQSAAARHDPLVLSGNQINIYMHFKKKNQWSLNRKKTCTQEGNLSLRTEQGL